MRETLSIHFYARELQLQPSEKRNGFHDNSFLSAS